MEGKKTLESVKKNLSQDRRDSKTQSDKSEKVEKIEKPIKIGKNRHQFVVSGNKFTLILFRNNI